MDAGTPEFADGLGGCSPLHREGQPEPLVQKGLFHDQFAAVRPMILRDEDFEQWFDEAIGGPSVPPSVVAGAFLLTLREGCSDRKAEQRVGYDLRWKWALGLGLSDHGCDYRSLCVFRARQLAHHEEGSCFTLWGDSASSSVWFRLRGPRRP